MVFEMSQVGGAHLKIKEVPDLGSSVAGWLRVLKQDTLALCVKTERDAHNGTSHLTNWLWEQKIGKVWAGGSEVLTCSLYYDSCPTGFEKYQNKFPTDIEEYVIYISIAQKFIL